MRKLGGWMRKLFLAMGMAFLLIVQAGIGQAQEPGPSALVLTIDSTLTPALAEYLECGLRTAQSEGAALLILQLNTPGGSLQIMNRMVQDIRGSSVPVVVYVSPRGAMAASAGTLITLAGHVAAMAPETTIGAASPVGPEGQDLTVTMQAKTKNELKATARALAERRGAQAVALAESTIENAQAVSGEEARQAGLVDLVATDLDDLLRQMDGRSVEMVGGEKILRTGNLGVQVFPTSLIERLLATLTNPNIVLVLMNIGVAAILIELSSPGGWVAGFIGVVCLALSVYGLGILPVNWFGLVFIGLAFTLFILDIKAPTHGALTAAGVGSLIAGGLVLFNSPDLPAVQRVSVPLAVGSALITGGMFFAVLLFAVRAQKLPVRTGMESLIGKEGEVISDLSPSGIIHIGGENWSAQLADETAFAPKGARVKALRIQGLTIIVTRVEE